MSPGNNYLHSIRWCSFHGSVFYKSFAIYKIFITHLQKSTIFFLKVHRLRSYGTTYLLPNRYEIICFIAPYPCYNGIVMYKLTRFCYAETLVLILVIME